MPLQLTPSESNLPFRPGDFPTLVDALDYAAQGATGANFFTGRGEQYARLPYGELRTRARKLARKLMGLGLQKGDRMGLVAETNPDFLIFFFACQYAGVVPVAYPATLTLGGHEAYVQQLARLVNASRVKAAMASSDYISFLLEAVEGYDIDFAGDPADYDKLPESKDELPSIEEGDIAYMQFTSGSTRFPRGVVIEQETVMNNLSGIVNHGIEMKSDDRVFSWLPFYHDMGLVGLLLVPVASQTSVDYLDTREFAVRPRQWLNLMTVTKATISFSPSFGYDLCTRRLRTNELSKYDLSNWRIAGIGAEMIRPETMEEFARTLAPAGFRDTAFVACYGMAECSLAISFAPLYKGITTDCIDANHLSEHHQALPIDPEHPDQTRAKRFVTCGFLLPDFEVEIRDQSGNKLPDRHSGSIYLRGPSVMSGYFNDPESTRAVLSEDGWLTTGDLGYMVDSNLVITGREKDLIIINGKNIWPQDLEYLAEQQPEVRVGGSLAFSVPNPNGGEICVLKIQCRQADPAERSALISRLTGIIRSELGIDCYITLVSTRKLPRTSSGKLSRSTARLNFMAAHDIDRLVEIADENELRKSIA
ncbi:MAG: fatty acyl-AMP ligase [Gammaproteobacteria bacterium]